MEQLKKRMLKNKKIWLTSGVALLLVFVLVVGQMLIRYERQKDFVSKAEGEEEIDLEDYQFTEGYEVLAEFDCPMDENVVAIMTYQALVTIKEEPEEDSTLSGNNTPENDETSSLEETPSEDSNQGDESDSDDVDPNTESQPPVENNDPEGEQSTPGTPTGGEPTTETPVGGDDSKSDLVEEENTPVTPESGTEQTTPDEGVTPLNEELSGEAVSQVIHQNVVFLSDIGGTDLGETPGEEGTGAEPEETPGEEGTGAEAGEEPGEDTPTDPEGGEGPEEDSAEEGPKEVEVTLHFTDLNAAFTAAQALYEIKNPESDEDLEAEPEPFIPRIVLVKDIVLGESLICSNPYVFELDFNGHLITFGKNASDESTYWDVQKEGTIILLDSIREGEFGGLCTESDFIFTGNAKLQFENGYFLAENGSIIQSALSATVKDGYFVFDREKKFFEEGSAELPDGKVFYPSTIVFREKEINCMILDDPDYMVLFEGNEEENPIEQQNTFLYATFEEAWMEAQELSATRQNETAKICVFDEQIVRIPAMETLVQTKGSLEISNLSFIRADEFRDTFFVVDMGELTLAGVHMDGTIYSEDIFVANDALVKVNTGTLHLFGTEEIPLVFENNTVSHVRISPDDTQLIETAEDEVLPDVETAGILVGNKGKVTLAGTLMIKNNWIVTEITEDNPKGLEEKNLTLLPKAELTISGKVTENSSIGIAYTEDVIAGLTALGSIGEDYLETFLAEGVEIQQPAEEGTLKEDVLNGDERLKVFSLDAPEYRAHYAMYSTDRNEVYWDKDQILLPEAGIFRIEYLLFAAAVYLMLLILLMHLIKKEPMNIALVIASVTCLILSLFFGTYRIIQEKRLARQNQEVMDEIIAMYEHPQDVSFLAAENENIVETLESVEKEKEEVSDSANTVSVPQDGREYIGIIEIEEVNIKLPVLAQYSGANMKTTPCVYYGEVGEPNLVIVGHNYDTQFGTLNTIGKDEQIHVKLTLTDGTYYEYVSAKREELNPDDVDKMLSSAWDMTIFTCNYVGDKRITFRCELKE